MSTIKKFSFHRTEGFLYECKLVIEQGDMTYSWTISGTRRRARNMVRHTCAAYGVASPV